MPYYMTLSGRPRAGLRENLPAARTILYDTERTPKDWATDLCKGLPIESSCGCSEAQQAQQVQQQQSKPQSMHSIPSSSMSY